MGESAGYQTFIRVHVDSGFSRGSELKGKTFQNLENKSREIDTRRTRSLARGLETAKGLRTVLDSVMVGQYARKEGEMTRRAITRIGQKSIRPNHWENIEK